MPEKISLVRSSMPPLEEYVDEIRDLWDTCWLTNMGVKHIRFESLLREHLGVENIVLFVNGHMALENTIAAMGLTGEVITTPYTFASTTHAIVRNGLEPVFCDIRPDDFTIDADKIEALITEKTSAIVPVHAYGNVCNTPAIDKIASKYGLKVIYDAAHAFGVTKKGIGIGTFGDAAMFSFHATKMFHTIEGGAVAFRDEKLRTPLDGLKNFGITSPGVIEYSGGNAKMNEFQAAMGICNLRYINAVIERRKVIFKKYHELLSGTPGITLFPVPEDVKSNYAYIPVVFDGYIYTRDEVIEILNAENIFPRKYFFPLTSDFDCYSDRFDPNATPIAKYLSERVLTLPIYPELLPDDVVRICSIILNRS
jgi:dTDP-4-amino-4,6-dideoxygalactose transaminase